MTKGGGDVMAPPFRWRPRQVSGLAVKTAQEWMEDKSPRQAAALAYYALFALGPLIVVAIFLAGLVFGTDAARHAVSSQISGILGPQGGSAVDSLVEGGSIRGGGPLAAIVGSVVLLLGAAALFAQLREALNRTWEVEEKAVQGWMNKLVTAARKNMLSFAGVIGFGFLLLVSMVIGAGLSSATSYMRGAVPAADVAWTVVGIALSVGVATVVFALMYKFLPNAKVAWRDVWVGAMCTGLLFSAGQFLIGQYLSNASDATKYAGAGALLLVLLWVYFSTMILLFGAELTQVYANLYGSKVKPSRDGEPIQEAMVKRDSPPDLEGTETNPGKQPLSARARHGGIPQHGPAGNRRRPATQRTRTHPTAKSHAR